jgi:hypothetical protein
MAERIDDRTGLVFGNQVNPRIQILPVVCAIGGVKIRPVRSRVPQAHRPRLRGRSDPQTVYATGAIDALKTPIGGLYGMTAHWERALRVGPKTGSKHTHQAQRSKRDQSSQLSPHQRKVKPAVLKLRRPRPMECRLGK